jgi:integrase/recombinase XerD
MTSEIVEKARIPTKPELKRLEAVIAASRYAVRDKLIFTLSYECGLRVHEIAALALSHAFDQNWEMRESVTLPKTKGQKKRHLFFSHALLKECLAKYLDERRKRAEKDCRPLRLDDPLVLSQKGGRFTGKSLHRVFDNLYKAAGIAGASSHSGRRYFATQLSHANVDMRSIQRLMGHESILTTAEYIDTDPIRLSKIVEKMPLWNK